MLDADTRLLAFLFFLGGGHGGGFGGPGGGFGGFLLGSRSSGLPLLLLSLKPPPGPPKLLPGPPKPPRGTSPPRD